MKIFDARFFGGALIVAVGLFSLVIGVFSILPPTSNILMGIILALGGAVLVKLGTGLAKDAVPAESKTAVDALRRAKLVGKGRKN